MNNLKKHKWLSKSCIVTLIAIFILILILNLLTPLVADDYAYATANTLLEVFQLEKIQYFSWGGRSVAHVFARTFLMLPKVIFSFINSLVFVLLIVILNWHGSGNLELTNPKPLIIISGLIFLFAPWFGQTNLWLTGSCNYLWMATIIFAFLLPYRMHYNHSIHFNYLYLIIMGVMAGWSNENAGGAALLYLLLMGFIELIVHHKKVWIPYLVGFSSCLFGFLMMILAPGNYVRAGQLPPLSGLYAYVHQVNQLLEVLFSSEKGMFSLILTVFVGLGMIIGSKNAKQSGVLIGLPLVCGIACSVAMILTPVTIYYDRSQYAASLWIVVACGNALYALMPLFKKAMPINAFCALVMGLSFATYAFALLDNGYFFIQAMQRNQAIESQLDYGNQNVVVSEYNSEFMSFYNPMKQLVDIDSDPESKINQEVATYYGLDTITRTPTFFFENVYKDGDYALMNIMNFNAYVKALKSNKNYSYLITTTRCDNECNALMNSLDNDNYEGMYHSVISTNDNYIHQADEMGVELFTYLFDKDVYLSSYEDANIADIVIDDVEYTFNNSGITIVTFDNNLYKVVDVVNFNHTNGYTTAFRGPIDQ